MKRKVLCAGLMMSVLVSVAGQWDKVLLRGSTDRDKALYAPNEQMVFTIRVDGLQKIPEGEYALQWQRRGDDGKTENGSVPLSLTEPLVIKTSLDRPGFVSITASILDKKSKKTIFKDPKNWNSKISFDGGAGVQIDQLKSVEEPADFDVFWTRQKARLAAVPVRADRTEMPSKNPKVKVYAVQIDCAGPRPATGFLTIPVDATAGKKVPAELQVHGYGTHVQSAPKWLRTDCVTLNLNAHGYALNKDPAYYKSFFESIKSNGKSYAFDPKQNQDPLKAYFNGMSLRVMRALQYLKSLPEWDGKELWVSGGSQGGLQTLWAAALDPQVTKASPGIPWCCDLGGITLGRISGGWRIPYVKELNYYDPVFLAKRIPQTCMVNVTRAGLGDYVCPPSGIAVMYNNLRCPKRILWVQGSTHGYVPPKPNQSFVLESK